MRSLCRDNRQGYRWSVNAASLKSQHILRNIIWLNTLYLESHQNMCLYKIFKGFVLFPPHYFCKALELLENQLLLGGFLFGRLLCCFIP